MSGLKYWLWLTTRQGLDAAGVLTVLDYFVTPERAYYADREEYDQLPLAPKARSGLYSKELDSADRILGDCQRAVPADYDPAGRGLPRAPAPDQRASRCAVCAGKAI